MPSVTQQIKDYFGDTLKPVGVSSSLTSLLPKETLDYLQQVGLPDFKQLQYGDATSFEFSLENQHLTEIEGKRLIVIRYDEPEQLCIAEKTGEVYAVYPYIIDSTISRQVFVNIEIQKYLLCQIVLLQNMETLYNLSAKIREADIELIAELQTQREVYLGQVENEISEIDRTALNAGSWWIKTLFDLRYMY
jgi:hypothetical protein